MTLRLDKSGYIEIINAYEIEFDAAEPFLEKIQSRTQEVEDLTEDLFGAQGPEETYPTLQRSVRQKSAVVRAQAINLEALTSDEGYLSATIQLESHSVGDASLRIPSRRILVESPPGIKIVGATGNGVVNIDERRVEFVGPPNDVTVSVELSPDLVSEELSDNVEDPIAGDELSLLELAGGVPLVALCIILVTPWFVLLVTLRTADRDRWARVAWAGALAAVCVTLTAFVVSRPDAVSWAQPGKFHIVPLAQLLVVLNVCAGLAIVSKYPFQRSVALFSSPIALVIAPSVIAVGATQPLQHEDPFLRFLVFALVVGGAGAVTRLLGHGAITGSATGLGALGLIYLYEAIAMPLTSPPDVATPAIALLVVGVLIAAPLTIISTTLNWPRLSIFGKAILFCAGAVVLLPVFSLAVVGTFSPFEIYVASEGGSTSVPQLPLDAIRIMQTITMLITVALLLDSPEPSRLANRAILALALTSTLIVSTGRGELMWFNVLGMVLTLAAWRVAFTKEPPDWVRLASISPQQHRKLFRAEVRRRMVELSAHDLYRKARSQLRDQEIDLKEYDAVQRRLDDAASPTGKVVDGVSLSASLRTGAGYSPARNAMAAIKCCLPVGMVIMGYEAWVILGGDPSRWNNLNTLEGLGIVLSVSRWLFYGILFGYYYTALRGSSPILKAFSLLLIIFPGELLSIMSSIPASSLYPFSAKEVIIALAIRFGQAVVFCAVLAFAWEARLAGAAGLRWDRLRNVRSVRSWATPIGTVAVAVATALGTAIAGAAVAAMLSSDTGPPAPAPSQSPSSQASTSPK